MPLRVIPVLDVKAGTAVHAVGGDRAHYRPIRSVLHPGSDPVELARAYRNRLGLTTLYLADLDAIDGSAPPDLDLYERLIDLGIVFWVDAGVRDGADVERLLHWEHLVIVAGLETLRGPSGLAEVLDRVGPSRLIFSLDLRGGVPVAAGGAGWGRDPYAIARAAINRGVLQLLLLDLARVGRGEGVGSLSLIERLRSDGFQSELIVGGGISGIGEFAALEHAGASAVLVGSALHDGRIGVAELVDMLM